MVIDIDRPSLERAVVDREISINFMVITDDVAHIQKVCEAIGRIQVGLALEGINSSLNLHHMIDEEINNE